MATLKTLSLNIATDVGQLSAGLAKGGKMVESFNAQVMKSFASVSAKMGGHFTDMFKFDAGAILSKITSFATSGMDAIDQLGDTAQSLGMTTAALSELRYAAKLAGSDAESLDMALTKLSANLGDAVQKASPTSDALKRLGLDAKNLANMLPDQAFMQIVGGFEKITNANERASLAMDIFGKGGIKLVNVLGTGAKGIADLRKEAQQLGVSVSQVAWAKVGAAKDAIDKAWTAVEGFMQTVAIKLSPLIEAAGNKLTEMFKGLQGGGDVIDMVLNGLVTGLASGLDALQQMGVEFDDVYKKIKSITEAVSGFVEFLGLGETKTASMALGMGAVFGGKNMEPTLTAGQKLIKGYEDMKKAADKAALAAAKVSVANLGVGRTTEAVGEKAIQSAKDLETFAKGLAEKGLTPLQKFQTESAKIIEAFKKGLIDKATGDRAVNDAFGDFSKDAKAIFDKTRTPMEKFRKEIADLQEQFKMGLIDDDTFTRATKMAGKEAQGETSGPMHAGAVEMGSREAYSAILAAKGQNNGNVMQKIAQEQLAVAKQMRDAFLKNPPLKVATVN